MRRMDSVTGSAATTLLAAVVLVAVGVVVIAADTNPAPSSPAAPAKDVRLFYQQNCAKCHGVDGTARGPDGKKLKGSDFTDAKWRKSAKESSLVKTVLKGVFFGLGMPGYKGQLTDEEATRLVKDVLLTSEKGKPIAP